MKLQRSVFEFAGGGWRQDYAVFYGAGSIHTLCYTEKSRLTGLSGLLYAGLPAGSIPKTSKLIFMLI